jgi:hypothetical protein
MSRCKVGECWDSWVKGQPDDYFKIDKIDGQGNFTGTHGPDSITGQCNGDIITYMRHRASGNYHYYGKYSGNDEVFGTRSARLARVSKRKRILDDDDWVGTHTT